MITRFMLLMQLLILSSCTLLSPQIGQQSLQQQLSEIDNWQVRGKLSVTSPHDSITGYLTWNQQDSDYQLFITGPFGQGSSQLKGSDDIAELLLPGWDQPQQASSAEQLMLTYMGWKFPVNDVRHWVKGQPAPGDHADTRFDESGLLQELKQHGWQVRYSRYSKQQGVWLPGLIKVTGHHFRFVFSIKEWTING